MANATSNGKPEVYTFNATMTAAELQAEWDRAFAALADAKLSPEEFKGFDADCKRCLARLAESKGAKSKTTCPISAADFLAQAKAVGIDLGSTHVTAKPKQFSTGSFGWNQCGKVELEVGDHTLTVQCSINLIVVGSKPEA